MKRIVAACLAIGALVACGEGDVASEHEAQADISSPVAGAVDTDGAQLGTVVLAAECSPAAEPYLKRGLALLHNMTYEDAEAAFGQAVDADAGCWMGYWGQAMTYVHPLWSDPPPESRFKRGQALLQEAGEKATDSHAMAYVEALAAYYDEGRTDSERPNLEGFEAGWQSAHEAYDQDPEIAAFYALAQLGTVDTRDKSYSKQRQAGTLAEGILEFIPDHPGAHHYVIHAYDNPVLASEAVDVARSYGRVAPENPHALHMPTHTFTRLGLWDESIDWNIRSARAALDRPMDGHTTMHYFHALDYLAYAYLQQARDLMADEVLIELRGVEPPYQAHIGSAYAFAAIPARLVLERHDWEAAADLPVRTPATYPWESSPATEAITQFARTLGASRSGRISEARANFTALSDLQGKTEAASPYWGTQVEIQRLSALAWTELAEGDSDQALRTMRSAAELESSTEKHPVTPGEVLPANELLGDMLLELGHPSEAIIAYQAALERGPNRYNSLFGAGRAAELADDPVTAARYYRLLLELTQQADTEREGLVHARGYLNE
jgi:tetratricopeptide (TPR) repeat protein